MIDLKFLDELRMDGCMNILYGEGRNLYHKQFNEIVRLAKLGLEYEQKKEEFKDSFDNLMKHTSGLMDSLGQNRFASIKESKPKKIERLCGDDVTHHYGVRVFLKINDIIDRLNGD